MFRLNGMGAFVIYEQSTDQSHQYILSMMCDITQKWLLWSVKHINYFIYYNNMDKIKPNRVANFFNEEVGLYKKKHKMKL